MGLRDKTFSDSGYIVVVVFLNKIYLLCFAYKYVSFPCVCQVPSDQKRMLAPLELEFMGSPEPSPFGCWE